MNLNERIEKEYVEAYKAKDSVRLGVLRLLKTAIKNRLVELKRAQGPLSDEELSDVIARQAKQRKDSIEQYLAAHRADLAEKEEKELAVLREYMPRQLTAAELEKAIDETIAALGAGTAQDMGRVIGAIMARYKGQADGREVSDMVRQKLVACQ